jgi:cyclase
MTRWKLIAGTDRQRTRCGKKPQYSEGLYDLGGKVYAWMVPNGSWGESNAGLVVGNGESLLIDTLWDLNFTKEMLRAMEPITRTAPVTCLVNTHADGDHMWGNQLLKNVEIIMTTACNEEARKLKPGAMVMFGKLGRTLGRLGVGKARKVGIYFHNMVRPYDFKGIEVKAATRTVRGETTLVFGGREVRLIEVGPAHSRGDLMIGVQDAKTLFCGDILFAGSTPVVWAGPIEGYISTLERIIGTDVDVLVPGHGPLSDKGAVVLQKEYLEYIRDEAGRCYRAGLPAKDAAYEIARSDDFRRKGFTNWDGQERIMVNTHMIYRHLQGRPGHLRTTEKLNILCEQAILACELKQSTPSWM